MKASTISLGILILLGIAFSLVQPCSADLGSMNVGEMSGIYSADPELEMPSANVSMRIVEIGEKEYSIEVTCRFMVVAQSLRNSSLAFIYPASWSNDSITFDTEEMFDITLDGEQINYTLYSREDIESMFHYSIHDTNVAWEGLAFAHFNVTLSPEINHFVEVETSFIQISDTDRYHIQYYFRSADTFSGDTHEIISVEIELQNQPLELNLNPEESRSISRTGLETEVVWDFIVGEIESPAITIEFVYSYPSYSYGNYLLDSLLIAVPFILVGGIIYDGKRRSRRRKQMNQPSQNPIA